MLSPQFPEAARDYLHLMDRGYPERSSLDLVGNRYSLDQEERMMLFRGVSSREKAFNRRNRLNKDPGEALAIDGYNVLFSIYHYLSGKPVFIGNDGFLRDVGASRGTISRPEHFERALHLLSAHLLALAPPKLQIYLDSPVGHSAEHAATLREALPEGAGVETVRSADYPLKRKPGWTLATADSAILDGTENSFYDLARKILEDAFSAEILDLGKGMGGG